MEKLYRKLRNGRYQEVDRNLSLNQEILLSCAFRYCLGRRTYVTSSCVEELLRLSDVLPDTFKYRTVKEIKEAEVEDNLGMAMDAEGWLKLADFWTPEKRFSLEANKYKTDEWIYVDEAYESNGIYYSIDGHQEYHTVRNIKSKNKSYNF